jgi:hypothetical protein
MYDIRIEFGIPMKLVRPKIVSMKPIAESGLGKYFPDMFPIGNDLQQGDALSPLLFNFALEYSIRVSGKP